MKMMRFFFPEAALLAVLTLFTTSLSAPAQGLWGKALSFDGVNDYVAFSRPVSDNFTLECWLCTTQRFWTSPGGGTNWWNGAGLIDGDVSGPANDFGLSLRNGYACFGTAGDPSISNTVSLADGQWHHVAATRSTNGALGLYVDGGWVASGTGTTAPLAAPPQLNIGRLASGYNYFQGRIDEVRVWNVVRTTNQIREEMCHPLSGTESNLAAYFRFDEGMGTVAYDATTNHWNGTLVNGPAWTNSTIPSFADINAGLLVRELFDGLSGPINGVADNPSSVGFISSAPWWVNPGSTTVTNSLVFANNFNVEVPGTNFMPAQLGGGGANQGGISLAINDNWDVGSWAMRPLAPGSRLNLGVDAVYYLTFNLMYRDNDSLGFGFAATNGTDYAFISIGINWNTTTFNGNASAKRLAIARGDHINSWPGVSGATAYSTNAQVNNSWPYVVLVKITTRASGNDTIQAAFFNRGAPGRGLLPADETNVVWDVTDTFTDNRAYDQLIAFINGSTIRAFLDAFRMGTNYAVVVQLAPLITAQPSPSPSDTVYAGVPVLMSVQVTGGAPAPYDCQWWKNSAPIADATNATFALTNPVAADAGRYFVVVTNRYGSVTSLTNTLTVLPARSWGNSPVLRRGG